MHDSGHGAFHESYFDHPCKVNTVTEKDVLETDIRGEGWYFSCRRWFHSWFLLSYDDERCHVYYVSSQALRLERARHFQKHRGRIHPLSKFSNLWTIFIFIVATINRALFSMNTAILFGRQTPTSLAIGVIIELILLMDFIVNFLTGYLDEINRIVILDTSKSIVHYVSSKLFIHFCSSIPVQCIMMLRYGLKTCFLCRSNLFVCYLKLLGALGIIRLYDVTEFLSREKMSFKQTHICKCFRIVILAIFTMLQFIDAIDTINLMIVIKNKSVTEKSYLSMVILIRYIIKETSQVFYICLLLSVLCKSVFLFGFGLYRHDYFMDKVFCLMSHAVTCIFSIWALSEIFAIVHRTKFVGDRQYENNEKIYNWMRTKEISNQLYNEVQTYHELHASNVRSFERKNAMYKLLPDILTREIKLSCFFRYIRRIPHFSEWPVELVEEMVSTITVQEYLGGDTVSYLFKTGEGLFVVYAGVLAVYSSNGKEIGHLIDGDYFGAVSLVTDREIQNSTVISVTASQVLLLKKDTFRKVMRANPKLYYELRTALFQQNEFANVEHLVSDLSES